MTQLWLKTSHMFTPNQHSCRSVGCMLGRASDSVRPWCTRDSMSLLIIAGCRRLGGPWNYVFHLALVWSMSVTQWFLDAAVMPWKRVQSVKVICTSEYVKSGMLYSGTLAICGLRCSWCFMRSSIYETLSRGGTLMKRQSRISKRKSASPPVKSQKTWENQYP